MPNAIAFFPWVALREPLIVGPLRLIRYERKHAPADAPYVTRSDIDGVLKAYAVRKSVLVNTATLMEIGAWQLGQDADDGTRRQLFRARELVAFTALAERQLFRGHFDYCNFDTYAFVIQNYQPGHSDAFSFTTRHRDGDASRMWRSEEFAFVMPLHVDSNAIMKLDEVLLAALLKADEADKLPYEAIVEFDRANTDSEDVPTHIEIVLTKSAFEYFFDISQDVNEFVDELRKAIPDRDPATKVDGPLAQRWRDARPKHPDRSKHGHTNFATCEAARPMASHAAARVSSGLRRRTWRSPPFSFRFWSSTASPMRASSQSTNATHLN